MEQWKPIVPHKQGAQPRAGTALQGAPVQLCPQLSKPLPQVEMSAFLKNTMAVKSMVSNGNEGWRTRGTYDPNARLDCESLVPSLGSPTICMCRLCDTAPGILSKSREMGPDPDGS